MTLHLDINTTLRHTPSIFLTFLEYLNEKTHSFDEVKTC